MVTCLRLGTLTLLLVTFCGKRIAPLVDELRLRMVCYLLRLCTLNMLLLNSVEGEDHH